MKPTNKTEKQALNRLQSLREEKKYIALSLWPPIGETIISKEATNRLFINEGRGGNFDGISDAYYMHLVEKFDSRS